MIVEESQTSNGAAHSGQRILFFVFQIQQITDIEQIPFIGVHPIWMLLRLAPGTLETRPKGLKQSRSLFFAAPRIITNSLQRRLRESKNVECLLFSSAFIIYKCCRPRPLQKFSND